MNSKHIGFKWKICWLDDINYWDSQWSVNQVFFFFSEPEPPPGGQCNGIICRAGNCVPRTQVCDLVKNCPHGEDETYCG